MKKSLPFNSPAKRLALFLPGLLLLSLLLSACQTPPASAPITESSFHFDTLVTVTIYDSKDKSLLTDCMELCDYYENIFSRTLEYAELAQLNEAAKKEENAGQALPLSDDSFRFLHPGSPAQCGVREGANRQPVRHFLTEQRPIHKPGKYSGRRTHRLFPAGRHGPGSGGCRQGVYRRPPPGLSGFQGRKKRYH